MACAVEPPISVTSAAAAMPDAGAALGLATADLGGKGGVGGDEDADQAGGQHGACGLFDRQTHHVRRPEDRAGQRTAGPRGRRGDDDAHGALGLHHGRRVEDHAVERAAVDQRAADHLRLEVSGLPPKDAIGVVSARSMPCSIPARMISAMPAICPRTCSRDMSPRAHS